MPRYSQDSFESKFRNDLIFTLKRIAMALEESNELTKEIKELTLNACVVSKENVDFNKFMLKFNMNLVSLGELVECLGLEKNEIDELQRRELLKRSESVQEKKGEINPDEIDKTKNI